jgi:hypothetical protein
VRFLENARKGVELTAATQKRCQSSRRRRASRRSRRGRRPSASG